MGFSLGNIAKAVVNPVGAGIEKLTGLSQTDQLKIGAGVGSAGALYAMSRPTPSVNPQWGGAASSPTAVGTPSSGFSLSGMLPGVVAGGLGLAGDIFGARTYAEGQERANEMTLQSAREQMDFQREMVGQQRDYETEMSNTAHQREVADLKRAGLNPVLSANSGASTPATAAPSGQSAVMQNAAPDYRGIVRGALSTALDVQRTQAEIAETASRIGVNRANQAAITADIPTKEFNAWASTYKRQYLEDFGNDRLPAFSAKNFRRATIYRLLDRDRGRVFNPPSFHYEK